MYSIDSYNYTNDYGISVTAGRQSLILVIPAHSVADIF